MAPVAGSSVTPFWIIDTAQKAAAAGSGTVASNTASLQSMWNAKGYTTLTPAEQIFLSKAYIMGPNGKPPNIHDFGFTKTEVAAMGGEAAVHAMATKFREFKPGPFGGPYGGALEKYNAAKAAGTPIPTTPGPLGVMRKAVRSSIATAYKAAHPMGDGRL
jgi:hypothetical protein